MRVGELEVALVTEVRGWVLVESSGEERTRRRAWGWWMARARPSRKAGRVGGFEGPEPGLVRRYFVPGIVP